MLQQRLVRRKPHLPAQSVHFPHEMTFRRAADCTGDAVGRADCKLLLAGMCGYSAEAF